jgi:hypothetical protein
MQLILIYGLPATGKLTVAQELSQLTGYKLFHNHLVVDLLLSVFDFGSAPFVQLREEIWLFVFEQACAGELPGLVFTFNPETTVTPGFVPAVINTVTGAGGKVTFIELTSPLSELRSRLHSPSRLQHRKLSSVEFFDTLHASGTFDTSHMPTPLLTIDTSRYTPAEAAAQISSALTTY